MLGWPAITQSESSNSVWGAKCSDSKSQITQACEPERDEEGTTRHAWTLAGFRCKVGCRWWKTCTSCQVLTTALLACFRMVWRIRGFLHCYWLLTHYKGLREGGLHQLISWVTLGFYLEWRASHDSEFCHSLGVGHPLPKMCINWTYYYAVIGTSKFLEGHRVMNE